jgi:hypothetical protein
MGDYSVMAPVIPILIPDSPGGRLEGLWHKAASWANWGRLVWVLACRTTRMGCSARAVLLRCWAFAIGMRSAYEFNL